MREVFCAPNVRVMTARNYLGQSLSGSFSSLRRVLRTAAGRRAHLFTASRRHRLRALQTIHALFGTLAKFLQPPLDMGRALTTGVAGAGH